MFFYISFYFMHIFIVLRIDLVFRSMRQIKTDIIVTIIIAAVTVLAECST